MNIIYRANIVFFFLGSIFLFSDAPTLHAQVVAPYSPVISQMQELESAKDAKCHATAARLEDFIYGTPLSMEARNERIQFQQNLVYNIWRNYSDLVNNNATNSSNSTLFNQAVAKHFQYKQTEDGTTVELPSGQTFFISKRDLRQYGSIAYAYRAILAVQQSCIINTETLVGLEESVLESFKKTVDIAVLALLNQADQLAREENQYQIAGSHITKAAQDWGLSPKQSTSHQINQQTGTKGLNDLVYPIIDQKLAAYQAYNQLNQAVFLRNIQVFLSKTPWPKETAISNQLKNHLTEIMVHFSAELLLRSQQLSLQNKRSSIQYEEVYQAVQDYLPHDINNFEDVTYFPLLAQNERIVIQSYDLDAFRDSGLHWQYLKFALEDHQTKIRLAPDPFALEMMVEGIAQFAVLIFRMAGMDATAKQDANLNLANINQAFESYQTSLTKHAQPTTQQQHSTTIQSAPEEINASNGVLFNEETELVGLDFQHRNSDWLSRLIRSYVVKEDENLARLAIPPAFGGGGVAAEDIDNDGWVDVLLLSGKGNRLYKNNKGKNLIDITSTAGITWQRADGTHGEPRQPIIVDFNNDGWQDILIIYANDNHRLYKNLHNGQFEDVTESAQLGGLGLVAGPATVIDVDNDGLLDIYIGYFGNYIKGELPTLKRHNINGLPNKLFRNKGNFTFEDISSKSGVENRGWTQAVGHTDINGDGWQDLIAGNDFGTNAYYINNHDGTFTDFSRQMGTDKPSYTMNIGIGDINNDQQPDFYISNIVVMEKDDKYVLPNEDTQAHFDPASLASMRVVEANDLFLSSQNDEAQHPIFVASQSVGRGFSSTGWSWDADFFDFDNDTDEDLYCLTGMNQYSVYGPDNPYYTTPDGEVKAISLAQSKAENNILFENKNGLLTVVEQQSGLDYSSTSRSAAYFDFDHDGDLDIIVNEFQEPAKFFRNQAQKRDNNWVSFKLNSTSASMNRDAIGSSITLTLEDGRQLWREVRSTTGYLSTHPKEIHFGLGQHASFSVSIEWANGQKKTYSGLKANQVHLISQNN